MMGDRLFITPSASCLGDLNVNDLVYVDFNGQILQSYLKPSSELPMHLEIYKKRPDVHGIIHTHPANSTAFTVAGENFSEPVLPELILGIGDIPIAKYATPSTHESAVVISELIKSHDVIILDHHGVVTVGKDLQEAFYKLERLEHAASTLLAAKQLGNINPLNPSDIEKLHKIKQKYLS
jgi:L-fuculose-phosphate aldolase